MIRYAPAFLLLAGYTLTNTFANRVVLQMLDRQVPSPGGTLLLILHFTLMIWILNAIHDSLHRPS